MLSEGDRVVLGVLGFMTTARGLRSERSGVMELAGLKAAHCVSS